ncbi:MAG: c(7)-type cytochrome triheme domain-containing protein, partial [Usitatibacteraceae bacterium]
SKGGGKVTATTPEVKKAAPTGTTESPGKSVYQATCSACHATGIAGAPKVGDQAAWAPRVKSGNAALYGSALKGKGAMPAKGGNAALPDDDVKSAVDFMVAQLGAATNPAVGTSARPVESAAVTTPVARVAETSASTNASTAPAATPATAAAGVNTFNRLLQAPGKRNLPPMEDGIHDAGNEATGLLQAPLNAYAGLPKSNAGNRIDWVKALNEKKLVPRADKQDQKAEMAVLELNIVREVKGSMPDVVYPHRQHTQWLDCSNCHPAIFIPQKGANQMSMASIILGQKCGVCHGKVAFPISECRMCHSKAKEPATVAAGAKP